MTWCPLPPRASKLLSCPHLLWVQAASLPHYHKATDFSLASSLDWNYTAQGLNADFQLLPLNCYLGQARVCL